MSLSHKTFGSLAKGGCGRSSFQFGTKTLRAVYGRAVTLREILAVFALYHRNRSEAVRSSASLGT